MKIKELYIENFGKLSKYRKDFTDGLNPFVEDNGYGKTTLTVFIKTMLYGFDETRRLSLDENDRKKYTPWQGGAFGGYLVFEAGGKSYRIERSFQTKSSDDTFTLYDLDTGMVSNDFSSNLGEELFGIDADGFERTVFLSEKNLTGKNTNQTISAKLSNLVGTEGDIGGFDDAIKLLDDRRKFYQKKGGAGEIQDTKREIVELEEEIRILYSKKNAALESEAEITALCEKIQAIKSKKVAVLAKERQEMLAKEKRGYEIQYSEMLGALSLDEKREDELLKFFEKKMPSNSEIAYAAESASEIKRLERTLKDIGENYELSSLKTFFTIDTTQEECDKMAAAAKEVSENKANIYSSEKKSETKSPFLREPSIQEIDHYSSKLSERRSQNSTGGSISILIIGLLLSFSGALLGFVANAVLYSLAAIGLLLTIVSIFAILRSKSGRDAIQVQSKVKNFICEVYGTERKFDSEISALFEMRADLEKTKSERERAVSLSRSREIFEENTYKLEREIREFTEKFPNTGGLTLVEITEEIAKKRRRYEMLMEYESEKDTERSVCKEQIKNLVNSLNGFISLFPTKTDDPISEIRRNLAEYDVIRTSLSRRRSDAERFASSHGISSIPKNLEKMLEPQNNFSHELSAIDEELLSAEREKSRLENDYNTTIREIEKIEELEEILHEKTVKAEIYEDNLRIITKAKDMLAKSKDNMTARYLDSTKQGFDKYVALFDEELGEFNIDTSFTVTKTDLGKSRQAEAYSRGTRDLHALAIRLALIDALYEGEKPPIILDDPFIAFDDKHIERAVSVLKKLSLKRQVLYFTCSKSRRAKQLQKIIKKS